MANLPPPENKPVETIDSLIHQIIMGVALDAAKAAAFAAAPWLKIPVLKQIFEFIANQTFSFISKYIEQAAAFAALDAQTAAQNAAYKAERDALIAAIKSGNPEEIENAKAKFKDALRRLIQFGN